MADVDENLQDGREGVMSGEVMKDQDRTPERLERSSYCPGST
jgi:hypothetical protein